MKGQNLKLRVYITPQNLEVTDRIRGLETGQMRYYCCYRCEVGVTRKGIWSLMIRILSVGVCDVPQGEGKLERKVQLDVTVEG